MRLDEPGHQCCTAPIDNSGAAEGKRGGTRDDGRYPAAFDQHRTGKGGIPGSIQDADIAEEYRVHAWENSDRSLGCVYRFSIYIRFQVGLMIT